MQVSRSVHQLADGIAVLEGFVDMRLPAVWSRREQASYYSGSVQGVRVKEYAESVTASNEIFRTLLLLTLLPETHILELISVLLNPRMREVSLAKSAQ